MTDRVVPDRSRSHSRSTLDHRRPSYYVLHSPESKRSRKRDQNDNVERSAKTPEEDKPQRTLKSSLKRTPSKKHSGIPRKENPAAKKVPSISRSPACNFLFEPPSSSNNSGQTTPRSMSGASSPERVIKFERARTSSSSPDKVAGDEPGDVVIWDLSKTSSIICPKSGPEYRCIGNTARYRGTRQRSQSLPAEMPEDDTLSTPTKKQSCFKLENACSEGGDVLQFSSLPSSPFQISPSSSVVSSSYSVKISLVTQQLDEIQQAQNEVLAHLRTEIAKVTDENERLLNELELYKTRNEELKKLEKEATEELEKYKKMFKNHGLTASKPREETQEADKQSGHSHHRKHRRSHKHRHSEESIAESAQTMQTTTGSGDPNGIPSCHSIKQEDSKGDKETKNNDEKLPGPEIKGISDETPPMDLVSTASEQDATEYEVKPVKIPDESPMKSLEHKRHSRSTSRHRHHDHTSRSRSSRHTHSPSRSPDSCSRDRKVKHRHRERSRPSRPDYIPEPPTGCYKLFPCCWSGKKSKTLADLEVLERLNSKY